MQISRHGSTSSLSQSSRVLQRQIRRPRWRPGESIASVVSFTSTLGQPDTPRRTIVNGTGGFLVCPDPTEGEALVKTDARSLLQVDDCPN
jgi:hypothetical protein